MTTPCRRTTGTVHIAAGQLLNHPPWPSDREALPFASRNRQFENGQVEATAGLVGGRLQLDFEQFPG